MLSKLSAIRFFKQIGVSELVLEENLTINGGEAIVTDMSCPTDEVNSMFGKYGCNIGKYSCNIDTSQFEIYNYRLKLVDDDIDLYLVIDVTRKFGMIEFTTIVKDLSEYINLRDTIDIDNAKQYLVSIGVDDNIADRLEESTKDCYTLHMKTWTAKFVNQHIGCNIEGDNLTMFDYMVSVFKKNSQWHCGVVVADKEKNIVYKKTYANIFKQEEPQPMCDRIAKTVHTMSEDLSYIILNLTNSDLTGADVIDHYKGNTQFKQVYMVKEGIATVLYMPSTDKVYNNYDIKTIDELIRRIK